MFAAKASGAFFSLVNVLIVSRALGPAGRGSVVFLMTVAILSSQIGALSISEAVSNIAGRSPERRAAVAGNAVVFSLVLGALAAGVVGGLIAAIPGFGPHVQTWLIVLAVAMFPALILFECLLRLVLADYGFAVINVATALPALVNALVNGLLYAAGLVSVASAFVVWTSGQAMALILLACFVQRRLAGFGRPSPRLGREMLSFGLRSHGSRVMTWGNYRLDQWLVGALAGSSQLGIYSVAVAWAEGLFLLPEALVQVQRPDLVRARRIPAGAQAARAFRLAALATAVLVCLLLVLAPFLCTTVFGSSFRGSVVDLRVLAVGAFGVVATKVFGNALIAQGKPLLEAIAVVAAFGATLVLDLLLIPAHGGLGAAIASTAAYSAGGLVVAWIASRTLGFATRTIAPSRADLFDSLGLLRRAGRVRARPAPQLSGDHD
jgi:O-antigen/teichoic acid export membrane protein